MGLKHMQHNRQHTSRQSIVVSPLAVALLMILVAFSLGLPQYTADAQTGVSFSSSGLDIADGVTGVSLTNPTSLDFGPDGRLYVSQQNGQIKAFTVVREGKDDYRAVSTEIINIINTIQNHDDDGTPNNSETTRQITGIYPAGTATNPILYVGSSDPRIGGGGGGTDKNLDTNSSTLSRLTCTGGITNNVCQTWQKVDLVRGLPRSEENHSINGIQLDESTNTLLVTIGGLTNAGAPSNNFAFITEFTYAGAIISVDLDMLNSMPILTDVYGADYIYDLPTLDDPTRPNVNGIDDPDANGYDGVDPGDPFGGNDGLNQAKIDVGGPVQLYATGFRNAYDIVITEKGDLYTVDNGANGGWGGHPLGEADYDAEIVEGTQFCTHEYDPTEPGSNGPGDGGDDEVNNKNGLHFVRELENGDFNFVQAGEMYYGGHPAPIRGNPDGAGLLTKGPHTVNPDNGSDLYWRTSVDLDGNGNPIPETSLPVDWPPVPASMAYAAECDFRNSGQDDNSLANYDPSTNGITEYTASNFGGELQGWLLMAAYNGKIYQVNLSEDGKTALNCPTPPQNGTDTVSKCQNSDDTFASGFGSTPLDVIAQGDSDVFAGTVWAATYGAENITIFEPSDYDGNDFVCTGDDDDTIDEDGDGYTNADEIDNGTDPCSGASSPDDFDQAYEFGDGNQFMRSNLLDADDDNDTLNDTIDPFVLDCSNGDAADSCPAQPPVNVSVPARLEFFNATNYGFGTIGFTGLMSNGVNDYNELLDDPNDSLIFGGTAGIYTETGVRDGTVTDNTQLNGFQFALDTTTANGPYIITSQINPPFFGGQRQTDTLSYGIQMGAGDQDNYIMLALESSSTLDGFRVIYEDSGSVQQNVGTPLPPALDASENIKLMFMVNPIAGTVQPMVSIDGGPNQNVGTPITLTGNVLNAVNGTHTISGAPSRLAVGTLATAAGPANTYNATWDFFDIQEAPSNAQAFVEVDTGGINGSTYGGGFLIRNDSATGEQITNVTFNTRSAVLPKVLFDPDDGTPAGDDAYKGFTPTNGSGGTTGVTDHEFIDAYDAGYYGLTIDFNDFAPGEQLTFAVDMDPISIQGEEDDPPSKSGSITGLEMSGTLVTVTYNTGETRTVELYRKQPDSVGGSNNIVRPNIPSAPSIDMVGADTQTVLSDAAQTVVVQTGELQSDVKLLQLESGMFVSDLEGPNAPDGYDVDPWDTNSVIGVYEYEGNTSNGSSIEFPVTLVRNNVEAGYNIFVAVKVDDDGATSPLSNLIIVEYDPASAPSQVLRINAGRQ